MKDIIEIVNSLEDSGLLLKGISETIQNEAKEQKGGFLSMLLGTLGASLLGNILASKEAIVKRQGWGIKRAGKRVIRAGCGNKKKRLWNQNGFSMPPHPLVNVEIQKYYQNESRFNGAYSRDNLQKITNGAYIINFDEYSDIVTHWVALYVQNNDVIYFDSFGVEHIPKEIKTFISNKNIKTNIFRIHEYDSIMCGKLVLG